MPPAPGARRGDPDRPGDRSRPPGLDGSRGARPARPSDRRPSEPVDDGTPPGHRPANRSSASTLSATDSGIPSSPGGPPYEGRVARRIGGRNEQPATRVARKPGQAPREALLDARRQRHRRGQPEPACELYRGQSTRQLQQRQRVAARLQNDPIQHVFVQASGQDRLQQRPRITMPQGLDGKLRQPGERAARLTSGEHDRDLLGQQAAGHERERARRRMIEPLRVVDDAQERSLLRRLGQQTERPPVRPGTDREPARQAARRRRSVRRAGPPAGAPSGRGRASTAVGAPRMGAPSRPRPRRSAGPETSPPLARPPSRAAPSSRRLALRAPPALPPSPLRAASSRRPSTSRSRWRPSNRASGGLVSVRSCDGEPIPPTA